MPHEQGCRQGRRAGRQATSLYFAGNAPGRRPRSRRPQAGSLATRKRMAAPAETQKTAHSTENLAGRREYDEWVAELFRLTDAATPRESLLRAFADRFAAIHAVDRDGPWVVVLEAEFPREEGSAPIYRGFYQRGAHPDQWKRFCEQLGKQADDPLLARVFKERKRLEQWYLPYFVGDDYQGLFDLQKSSLPCP